MFSVSNNHLQFSNLTRLTLYNNIIVIIIVEPISYYSPLHFRQFVLFFYRSDNRNGIVHESHYNYWVMCWLSCTYYSRIFNVQRYVKCQNVDRGKSPLESWLTTFLHDSQLLLIFVRFISNFLCICTLRVWLVLMWFWSKSDKD